MIKIVEKCHTDALFLLSFDLADSTSLLSSCYSLYKEKKM